MKILPSTESSQLAVVLRFLLHSVTSHDAFDVSFRVVCCTFSAVSELIDFSATAVKHGLVALAYQTPTPLWVALGNVTIVCESCACWRQISEQTYHIEDQKWWNMFGKGTCQRFFIFKI